MKNKLAVVLSSSVIVGSLLMAGTAFAQTNDTQPSTSARAGWSGHAGMGAGRAPGVFGTVSAVNGTSLTVTSKGFGKSETAAAQTYTVNAANATVTKAGVASTVGAIAVGDTVMVAGTVSGTSVTATTIRDGMGGPGMGMKPGEHASSTPSIIQGNGQPVIGGTVSAVNGNSLTVTTAKGNVTYTVDVTSATIEKGNAASTVSAIAVGDAVVVQGTVSGSSVTASSVMDSGAAAGSSSTATDNGAHKGFFGGMMGSIGGFFHNLFGFF